MDYYNNYCKIHSLEQINANPFNARISELVAVGILEKSEEIKSDPMNTTEGPYYKFNQANYAKFLQEGD